MGLGALVGLGFGVGPLFEGFYAFPAWGGLSAAATVILIVTLVVSREAPPPMALVPILGLVGLAAVQFASLLWAESADQVLADAHRTAFYAVLLALITPLANRQRGRVALLAGVTAGALVVSGYEAVRLLASSPPPDFLRGRLQDPLGYVNGMAAALLLGFWPLVGAAESARTRLGGPLAVSGASFLLALGVLVQSRGALAALGLSALLVCAVLPGRNTRLVVLLVLGAGLVVSWESLTQPFESTDPQTGLPAAGTTRDAVLVALAVALASGLAFGLIARLAVAARRLRAAANRVDLRRIAAVGAALVAAAAVLFVGGDVRRAADERWSDFRSLKEPSASSRLSSAGGNRYDYWRIAIEQFADRPLEGVGAGNYDRTYFLDRRTSEDIRQPHSLPLQVLGETGLLGFACLTAFLVGIALAVGRARPAARKGGADRALIVGASGLFAFWIVHTSVDWLHLLPSVTGAALVAAAVLTGLAAWPPAIGALSRFPLRPLAFAAAVLVTASLGVLLLADRYRRQAEKRLPSSPAAALTAAQRALELNDESLPSYYALAAAQARLNRYHQARATLDEASRREPHDWLPPALLGDLAYRRGDYELASRNYRRALELNPRSRELAGLVTRASQRKAEAAEDSGS